MNIFYLHKDPVVAAQMSCDKHVVKMILESAQLLSTCHRVQDGTEYYGKTANGRKIKRWKHPNPNLEPILYKAGWVKHPSTIWLFESAYNYMWLYKHFMALNEEYKKRYNHTDDHIAVQKLGQILSSPPKNAKINKIAIETASELTQKLIGAEVNNSSITAIVDDLSKRGGDKYYGN